MAEAQQPQQQQQQQLGAIGTPCRCKQLLQLLLQLQTYLGSLETVLWYGSPFKPRFGPIQRQAKKKFFVRPKTRCRSTDERQRDLGLTKNNFFDLQQLQQILAGIRCRRRVRTSRATRLSHPLDSTASLAD
nr:uncharacterized protein LOC116652043 [Drosophila virilis]